MLLISCQVFLELFSNYLNDTKIMSCLLDWSITEISHFITTITKQVSYYIKLLWFSIVFNSTFACFIQIFTYFHINFLIIHEFSSNFRVLLTFDETYRFILE